MSQSSLIRSPPPSSLLRSNLLSVRILSQSTSSQPLSATAALFYPKRQIFFAKFSDWSTKSKTLTASPRFLRYFSSSLKTNSHHMLSAKSTNSITSPNSGSSSTDTSQSSQLKFQPHLTFHFHFYLLQHLDVLLLFHPFLHPQLTPYIFTPLSTSCHHLVPNPPSKVLPATPDYTLHVAQHVTEKVQISPPAVPHVARGLMHLNLLAKTTTKFFLVGILFLLFSDFYLVFCIFLGRFYHYV